MTLATNWLPANPKRLIATTGFAAVAVSMAFAVPQTVSSRDVQRDAIASNGLLQLGMPVAQAEYLEVRRTEYLRILTNLHEVSEIFGAGASPQSTRGYATTRSTAARTMEMVQRLSHAELTLMMHHVPDLSRLLQATSRLSEVARDHRREQGLAGHGQGIGGTIASGGFPDAPYSYLGVTRPSTGALQAASVTFEFADDVRELAGRACDQIGVIGGFGANTATLCLITDGVWVVAKSVFWFIQFESDDVDSAEILGIYNRTAHLHTDIESLQSSVNAHDTNIDADLIAHDTNIDSDLSAHDTNIDADLVAHDANIDADLITHDMNIQGRLGVVQGTLDNEIELRRVHLQAIQIVNRRTYMIVATEAGKSANVSFDAIQVFDEGSASFQTLGNAAVTQVATGTYVIHLNLSGSDSSKIFRVQVTHDDVVDHYGEIVFHRNAGTL